MLQLNFFTLLETNISNLTKLKANKSYLKDN